MSIEQIDYIDWSKFLPNPPLLTSFQLGWNNIQLAHNNHSSVDVPEMSTSEHIVIIPLGHQTVDFEFFIERRKQIVSYQEKDYAGCIENFPANLSWEIRSNGIAQALECIYCYLAPTFLAQVAYESVNPDCVELLLTPKKVDVLIYQIGLALKSSLEEDGVSKL